MTVYPASHISEIYKEIARKVIDQINVYYFTHAIVLIFIGYTSTYPFFFWTTPLSKIDQGFYRFNLGKCCVVGSLGVIAYYFILPYDNTQLTAIIWLSMLTIIAAFYWNSKKE